MGIFGQRNDVITINGVSLTGLFPHIHYDAVVHQVMNELIEQFPHGGTVQHGSRVHPLGICVSIVSVVTDHHVRHSFEQSVHDDTLPYNRGECQMCMSSTAIVHDLLHFLKYRVVLVSPTGFEPVLLT